VSGSSPRRSWTPWTGLLRDVIDQDHRTVNAQKLLRTVTVCAVVLLATAIGAVALVYLAWGPLPAAGAATGVLSVLGGGGWYARSRRRRNALPSDQAAPPPIGPPP